MRKKFTWLLSLMVTIGLLGIFSHGYANKTHEAFMLYADETSACETTPVLTFSQETCYDGVVVITVTEPVGTGISYLFNEDVNPANWQWKPYSTGGNIFEAKAGETVTLRIKTGDEECETRHTFLVPKTIQQEFGFSVTKHEPACINDFGALIVTAVGGTPPYTYYVNTSATIVGAQTSSNFQFSAVPGVTYYIAAQDANGCFDLSDESNWETETISDDLSEITVVLDESDDVTCFGGNDGSFTVIVSQDGYNGDFEVSINGGLTWVTTEEGLASFDGLIAGAYTVIAKNSLGCPSEEIDPIEIDEPEKINFDITIKDTTCGGEPDGQVIVSNISGVAPYTFDLVGGTTTPVPPVYDSENETYTFIGLQPTYYSLTITDVNGCVVEYENPNLTGNVIAVQAPGEIVISTSIVHPLCFGDNGTVTVSATGGSGTYQYGTSASSATLPTNWGTVTVFNLPAGDHYVWVRNAAVPYCEKSFKVTVKGEPELLSRVITANIVPPTCDNGTDGIIPFEIEGGVKPYKYSINNGIWSEATNSELIHIAAAEGDYVIKVKDANGCEAAPVSVTVSQVSTVITASKGADISCNGGNTTITATVAGPAGRTYNYYYTTQQGVFPTTGFYPTGSTTSAATTFTAGTYYVAAIDKEFGCKSDIKTVTITHPNPFVFKNVYATGASCFMTADGIITILAEGGNTSQKKYAITNTPIQPGISSSYWVNFAPAVDGIFTAMINVNQGQYYAWIQDGCGVKAWGPVINVDGYRQLKITDETKIVKTDILCKGDETGAINVPMSIVDGGAGSYLFTLLDNLGVAMEGYEQQATGLFENLPAGTYKVLVEDTEGCPSYTSGDVVLNEPANELAFDVDIQHISCYGANDGLIKIKNVAGGTTTATVGYSYAINNSNNWLAFGKTGTTWNTSKTYVATGAGTFKIWVKDANGCIAGPVEVIIEQPDPIVLEIVEENDATCYGAENGSLEVEVSGGWDVDGVSVTYQYKVNDGDYSSTTSSSTWTYSGLPAGEHVATVKVIYTSEDSEFAAGNCEVSVPFEIGEPAELAFTFEVADVACKGEETGEITVTVTGGTPDEVDGYTVVLLNEGVHVSTLKTGEESYVTFDELAAGTYTVTVTDANNCRLSEDDEEIEIVVEEPETLLTVSAQWIKNVSCYGLSDGSFSITASGGSAPYKFFAAKSVLPDHVLLPDPDDNNAWISVVGNTYTKTNASAGTWIIWAMDANGCIMGGEEYQGVPVNEWRVQILQPAQIVFSGTLAFDQPSCNGASDGVLKLTGVGVTGGTAPRNLVVMKGSEVIYNEPVTATVNIEGVSAGVYSAKIVDANGCESTAKTITVTQPTVLSVTASKAEGQFACPDDVSGFIQATASGGAGNYQYRLWRNSVPYTGWVTESAFAVAIGYTYIVEVRIGTNSECNAISAPVEINPVAPATITAVDDLTCFDVAVPKARISATGEAGRKFFVRYQKVEGSELGDWSDYEEFNEEEGAGTHVISTGLTYGNDNESDGHYNFQVKDEYGCVSEVHFMTFVKVQHALAMTHTVVEGECTSEVTFSVNGGIAPYEIWIDGVMMEDGLVPNTPVTLTLEASEEAYEVVIRDAHECTVTVAELLIEANPVTDEVTVETYFDEEVHYVNEAYEVDEMLNAEDSPYTFEFTTEEGCLRVLTVTVVEVYREVAISAIQGTGAESPLAGMKRAIRGTVTGVVAGQGYFVQDASEAWSGIWVADATTTVAIGDGVYVEGTVSEVNGVTTLTGTGEKLAAAPVTITAVVLASPELAKDEKYESVLVQVKGVRAAAVDGDGKWEVYTTADKRATVNKWLFTYAPVTGNFYDVTGIVDGRAANYYLNPRMTSDIRDITATTDITVIDAVDFKVYPNPFNNELYIDNHNKLTRVSITNIAGQRVLDVQYPERVIRTANLVSGVYVVTLFTEEGIVKSERIVKR